MHYDDPNPNPNLSPSPSQSLALPSVGHQPERLHAFLLSRAQGPWPATAALLGHTPTLRTAQLLPGSATLPAGTPGFGDLVLVLTTPDGGVIHALVTGPLARGLTALLLDEDTALPATPLSASEAGLLAGLAAAALEDLAPAPNTLGIQDVAVIREDDALPRNQSSALPSDSALLCDLTVSCGPATGHLLLLMDTAAARSLRDSATQWRPSPSHQSEDLPLTAELVLARSELVWSRLTNLAPGDAVVFPCPAPPDDQWSIHLEVANLLFPATLQRTESGREVEITGSSMDPTDSSDPSISSDPSVSSDPGKLNQSGGQGGGDLLDRLPVTLTAVLGRVEVSAGDVARLAPGAVISLDHPVGDTIQLRAGSRTIAAGELVEVDGSLGVRITQLTL